MIKRLLLCALLTLSFSTLVLADGVADQVTVQGAYVRAVPPGLTNSAAFMTLNNTDTSEHKLVAAESPVSEVVELHTHINDNGVMRMRRVENIPVPAEGVTELKPGGLHVMLIGLQRQLKPGEQVDLTLVFEDGSKTRLQAPVKKISAPVMKCGKGKCGGGKCGGGKCGGGKCGGAK